ncbi:MAG: hypothetical protein WBB07_23325 [Mycobacterium sp.]
MADLSEQAALVQVVERLTGIFAGVPAERIRAEVSAASAHFAASPIRDFIPLLVERRARAELVRAGLVEGGSSALAGPESLAS